MQKNKKQNKRINTILGVYILNARVFRFSLDTFKRGFHRAADSSFGKVGRVASEEVVIQLISSKCMPILLCGLKACALNSFDIRSLDFMLNSFCANLFKQD